MHCVVTGQRRKPVQLDFVDFVRVYTGLNQKCGWLLETSTEILGAEDVHLDASLQAIRDAVTGINLTPTLSQRDAVVYDLQGRKVQNARRGLYVKNGKKYFIQ